ncbi:MAG TPA: hypothetical protein VFN26_20795 [Candidatus Acidoferrum sp.]|nr:hypothetical protein [Candidatus Acidoferrum sp.]
MGRIGVHPAVFVRVANKRLTAYGTWKSAQVLENKGAIRIKKEVESSTLRAEGGRENKEHLHAALVDAGNCGSFLR